MENSDQTKKKQLFLSCHYQIVFIFELRFVEMNNMKSRVVNPEELRKKDLKNNIFTKCFRITSIEKYHFYVKRVETSCASCREGCTSFNGQGVLIKKHLIKLSCLVAKWNSCWNHHCYCYLFT